MLGSIQMSGERLSSVDVKEICESLAGHNVRLLLMRECHLTDEHFNDIMDAVGRCKSILQLNLNLGVVNSLARAQMVASALGTNRSLQALFLHGSPIGDPGASIICRSLSAHPQVISLDMGDCLLTDAAIPHVVELLPPNGAKPGLKELTLSANPGISTYGWMRFFVAMAASSCLRCLSIDYNNVGDAGASCLAVALASNRTLHTLDLEATGIGEEGGKLLLHLVRNYPTRLRQLCLAENHIKVNISSAIDLCLEESDSGHDDRSVSIETPSVGGSSPEHYHQGEDAPSVDTDSAAESSYEALPPPPPPAAAIVAGAGVAGLGGAAGGAMPAALAGGAGMGPERLNALSHERTGYKVALTTSQGVLSLRSGLRGSSVESDAVSEQSSTTA